MKFDNINSYLTGTFIYKYRNNYLPVIFTNYFSKMVNTHDHYKRALEGGGLTVKYARTIIDNLH